MMEDFIIKDREDAQRFIRRAYVGAAEYGIDWRREVSRAEYRQRVRMGRAASRGDALEYAKASDAAYILRAELR